VKETDAQWDIQYLGSLARAQRLDHAQNIERWVMMGGNLAPVLPGTVDVIDEHEVMRYLGRSLNIPAAIMRDKEEVKAITDERKAAQAQMQQAVGQQMQGEAMAAEGEGLQQLAAGQQAAQSIEGQ
jgi:hypothetical protein